VNYSNVLGDKYKVGLAIEKKENFVSGILIKLMIIFYRSLNYQLNYHQNQFIIPDITFISESPENFSCRFKFFDNSHFIEIF